MYEEKGNKDKIKIMHVAQAAGGVDRYLRTLLKYLDKEKFENIVVLSQNFKKVQRSFGGSDGLKPSEVFAAYFLRKASTASHACA